MKGVFSAELEEIEQMIIQSKYQESLKRLDNLLNKSYSAIQKMKKLITDFSAFSEIWENLNTKINSSQELSLSDRTKLSDYLESIFV